MSLGSLRLLLLTMIVAVAPAAAADAPPGTPVSFVDLPGFAADDLPAAFGVFRASCVALAAARPSTRAAASPPPELTRVCAALPRRIPRRAALRSFFERHFTPRRVAGSAFFTGYYEPVVDGALVATKTYATPLYAPPPDLVGIVPGARPGLDPALTVARRGPDGRLVALPDRAAIETGALGTAARPLVYVASRVDAFFIQVQGSARIRLPDGTLRRLVYAARNGYPYTSIGKVLVGRLHVPPSAMGMAQLRAWIQANGQGDGDAGAKLMRENRSFIFFRFDDSLPAGAGPIGGEGLSLTPRRSLAIDHNLWPYGLPFYVDTRLPDAGLPEGRPFRRLMIGQDTGAAILGAARADIFFGTGLEAARQAGAVRQPGTLFVLWPKAVTKETATGRPVARGRTTAGVR